MISRLTPMLRVPDEQAIRSAMDWYQRLGFEVRAENQPEGRPLDWVLLASADVDLMITLGGGGGGSATTLYLYTDDVEGVQRSLAEKGIEAELETAFHGMQELTVRDPNGFGVVFGQRVSEQPSSIRRSDLDPLTGLATKPLFDATIARLAANGRTLSVAILDVDDFARINAVHGRDAADDVLRQLARLLIGRFPDGSVFRIGGDEFSVLMQGLEKEQAFLQLERARSDFEAMADRSMGEPIATLSVGVATCPDDATTHQEVLRKADDAMYRAKTAGRNRVALAREEKKVPKTSHYTQGQLERLSVLADKEGVGEAELIREALDGLLKKYAS